MKIDLVRSSPTDEEMVDLIDRLHSSNAGSYHRNHCLIRLHRDTSFWHPDNEVNLAKLAVFVHEYLHFVHNFSTVAGLYDFVVQLRLLRLFCTTVGADGRSAGSNIFGEEEIKETRNLLAWRKHLRGEATSQVRLAINSASKHLPLIDIRPVSSVVQLSAQRIECHGIRLIFDGAQLEGRPQLEVLLGSEILMEGCAFEAECALFQRCGEPTDRLIRESPPYPYRTARTIFESITGLSPSSHFICSICVLALQSTDPGAAFLDIANACKCLAESFNEDETLNKLKAPAIMDYFRTSIPKILEQMLVDIQPFQTRGQAGRGLKLMTEWCKALFEQRLRSLSFEIDALNKAPDLEPFVDLFRAMPTCPVIQEVDSVEATDELLFFSEEEIDPEIANELGAAQSLLQFASSHLRSDGVILPTSNSHSPSCLFINACRSPQASENPTICQQTPWKSFNPEATVGCWYAAGVSAARARATTE